MSEAVAKIDALEGAGNVLIIRASGESVIAKVGDDIFEGDTVVTSSGSSARISVNPGSGGGVLTLDSALFAKFDSTLFDSVSSVLPDSSEADPVAVGQRPPAELVDQFNEVFSSGNGIVSTDAQSQSDTVIENQEGSPSANGDNGDSSNPIISNDTNPLDLVERRNSVNDEGDDDSQDDSFDVLIPEIFRQSSDRFPLFDEEDIQLPDTQNPQPLTPFNYNLIDDEFTTLEDEALVINVLSNDEFNGTSLAEILGLPASGLVSGGIDPDSGAGTGGDTTGGITEPVPDMVDPGTGGGGTGGDVPVDPPIDDPGTGGVIPDTTIDDPASGGDVAVDPVAFDPTTDPNIDPVTGLPIGSTSTEPTGGDSGGRTSFIRRIINFFRSTESGDEGVNIELDSGFTINIRLLSDFSENGGEVELNSDGSFAYDPPDNFNGVDTFSYVVTLPDGTQRTATVSINVVAQNDAPVNTVPDEQTIDEDTALVFSADNNNQLSIDDVDNTSASDTITATLSVLNGTLTVLETSGANVATNGSGSVSISGSLSEVNAAIATVTYQGNANFNGSDTLTLTTNDGDADPLTDTDTVTITVNSVNDEPVNNFSSSGTQSVTEGQSLVLGDIIDLSDADGDLSRVVLSVSDGILQFSSSASLSVTGNGTNTVTIEGSEDQINVASSVTYQADADGGGGSDTLSLSFSDAAGATVQVSSLIEINIQDSLST